MYFALDVTKNPERPFANDLADNGKAGTDEETASGAAGDAECVVAERLISCADDESRSLSAALSLDFPNMLLSLLLLLVKLRLA